MENNFNDLKGNHLKILNLYVPTVARVHGNDHPEFIEVEKLYYDLNDLIKNEEDLKEVFKSLRKITNDYKVPEDTCESYKAVYVMLEELDESYNN